MQSKFNQINLKTKPNTERLKKKLLVSIESESVLCETGKQISLWM